MLDIQNRVLRRKIEKISNIILIGLPGCGKSSVGRELARKLGLGFFDLDENIEKEDQADILTIFQQKGEKYFREKEEENISSLAFIKNHVISVGGGAILSNKNRQVISSLGLTVWLNVPISIIVRRLFKSSSELKKRPFFTELDYSAEDLEKLLTGLLKNRKQYYKMAKLDIYSENDTYCVVRQIIQAITDLDVDRSLASL